MPISKYNNYFGGNANKAKSNMMAEYGSKKGEQVFYATKNKRKKRNPKQEAIQRRMSNGN